MQDKFDRRRLQHQGRVNPPDAVLKKVQPPQEFNLEAEMQKMEKGLDLEQWKQVRIQRPE